MGEVIEDAVANGEVNSYRDDKLNLSMGLPTKDGKTQHDLDEDDYYRSIGVDPNDINADLPNVTPSPDDDTDVPDDDT